MHTKLADPAILRRRSDTSGLPPAPSVPDTAAYWLEDQLGTRVTKLYRAADIPMVFAGRALENCGHIDGWSLVRRTTNGERLIVASGSDLALLARPFMPERTPEEAAALAPFFAALRRDPDFPTPDPAVTDERVY